MDQKGKIIIISAPSGCGKTTICHALRKERPDIILSVSATTRPPRGGERDGKDYFFITEEEFKKRIGSGAFAEWAVVYGQYYGTPAGFLQNCLTEGKICLLDIDVQGGMNIMKKFPEADSFFIMPPSLEELERRLKSRATDKDEDIRRRLEYAKKEMECRNAYDHVLVNDRLESVVKKIIEIING